MSKIQQTKLLKELGMKDIAIAIYLFLLKKKQATILEISRGTGISRTNIYQHIPPLVQANLIGESIEGKKKTFYIEHPENLSKMVEQKLDIAKQATELFLPDFKNNHQIPNIRFGHGKEGFKKFCQETLHSKEKILYQIVNLSHLHGYSSRTYLEQYWRQRVKKGIHVKILTPSDNKTFIKNDTNEVNNINFLREVRFLPENFDPSMAFMVFDTTVQFFAPPSEGYIFSFESDSFSNSIKSFFNFLWDLSEPFKDQ